MKHILILIQRTVSSIEYFSLEGNSLHPLYTAYARKHPSPSNQTLADFFDTSVRCLVVEDEGQANTYIRDIRDKVLVGDELDQFMDSFKPIDTLIKTEKKAILTDK